jgi:protein-tyrosine phosphatase
MTKERKMVNRIGLKSGMGLLATVLVAQAPTMAGDIAQAGPVAAASAAAHQRLLPLEGGQNFRDLGGYAGADGRTVRWGVLFRSGSMHGLTPSDFTYLEGLHIRSVVDFRSPEERKAEPITWPKKGAPTVLVQDRALLTNPMMKALFKPGLTAEEASTAMAGLYAGLPFQLADQYKAMFARLLAGDAPLIFNCTAGKDRTGVAAALLLTVLGVPRATIYDDYLLSNQYFRPAASAPATADGGRRQTFQNILPEAIKALVGADRRYLEAAFAAIDSRPGGMSAYLHDELGLTPVSIAALRARYLQ